MSWVDGTYSVSLSDATFQSLFDTDDDDDGTAGEQYTNEQLWDALRPRPRSAVCLRSAHDVG